MNKILTLEIKSQMHISEQREVAVSWKCSYHDGMFSHDSASCSPSDLFWEIANDCATTCFHEAGHAVVGYILGLGCADIRVTAVCGNTVDGMLGFAWGGMANGSKIAVRRADLAIDQKGYCREALAVAVRACAGPAAERRLRHEREIPHRSLFTAQGDHRAVEGVAKFVWRKSGRDSHAFQRLAWREAQNLLSDRTVWSAVCSVAEELECRFAYLAERDEPGTETGVMPGATARAIMRRSGVRLLPGT